MNQVAHLPTLFWSKVAAREMQDHRVVPLQFGQPSLAASVIRQLVIGKRRTGLNIVSHRSQPP